MTTSNSMFGHFAQGLLRVVTGFLFTAHGTVKLFGVPAEESDQGLEVVHKAPEFLSQIWFAGALELVGGVLILIGLWTRSTAFICSGLMAFAYFLAHAGQGFWPVLNGGETAVLYCFVFLFLVASGPGALSVDGLVRGRRVSNGGSGPSSSGDF